MKTSVLTIYLYDLDEEWSSATFFEKKHDSLSVFNVLFLIFLKSQLHLTAFSNRFDISLHLKLF
jgi:hypothetical protein